MFAKAMNSFTSTWNGALSMATPDLSKQTDGRLSLFFKATRGITDDKLFEYLIKASDEDLIDTFILSFNVRDSRGGKGERDLGRKMFTWLFKNKPIQFEKVFHLVPEYGRWDDLLCLFPGYISDLSNHQKIIQKKIVNLYTNQLQKDKSLMLEGKPVSICAKWCPSEGDSDDKKFKLVASICEEMCITPREYRKEYTTPLRTYLNIVEKYMCEKRWDEIDFSKTPSCAMKKLKNAFEKNTPDTFNEWKSQLSKGEVTVNANQLFPHELVREMRTKGTCDEVCKVQWQVLEDEVRKLGVLEDCVIVVDTSSSMETPNYLPLDIACAMGLIISSVVEGEFKGNVITFNNNPEFVVIRDDEIYKRYTQLRNIPWGGSTNLQGTFDMILERGKVAGLTNKQMPKRIIMVSDMQFNDIVRYGYGSIKTTNFQEIERKYSESAFTRPDIVFWNVNGKSSDFPVTVDDNGTCLISGASPSILKSIIRTKDLNSFSVLRETLDDKRYSTVRTLLS